MQKAREALVSSYSPYSGFPVGAAILLENGDVITGSNQENAAYPSGLCAERVAFFYAGAKYPGQSIKAVAVAVSNQAKEYAFPCGACLQVISEYQHRQNSPVKILIVHPSLNEVLMAKGVQHLLPFGFNKDHLHGI